MHYSTVTLLALSCMLLAFVNPGLAAAECVNGIQKEIIDNEDVTRFTTSGGAWTKITMTAVSNRARHYNETMMRTVKAANQVAYFDASGLSTGTYEVATFWQAGAARYPKVNYSIVHAGGVDMVKVNQRDVQPDIADFFVLGNYTFTNNQAGAGVYINSGPRNANIIIADAVSFSSVCTETSTSVSPTSASPTSVSPTSASPTSVSPTSASPTSVSPTTTTAGIVFEVTGVDAYPDFNGYYKQDGTFNNKPDYYKVNADGSSFTDNKRWNIYFGGGNWRFFDYQNNANDRYKVLSSAATPPTTGWVLYSDSSATNIALTYI